MSCSACYVHVCHYTFPRIQMSVKCAIHSWLCSSIFVVVCDGFFLLVVLVGTYCAKLIILCSNVDNFHAYIFHGNFCFPCGNSFPWNTAKFLSDFLFPLISTRFSLDTYSSRNAQGFPWYLLVGYAMNKFTLVPLEF